MFTNAFNWLSYLMLWSACRAATIRLVPTSRPIAGVLVSAFILVLLIRAPLTERPYLVTIAFLQKGPIFRNGHLARFGGLANSVFRHRNGFPDLGARGIPVHLIVTESEQVQAGRR